MNGDDVNLDRVRVALLFDRPYVYSSPARVPQLPYFAGVQDPLPQTDASGAGSVRDLLPRSGRLPRGPAVVRPCGQCQLELCSHPAKPEPPGADRHD